MSLPGLAFDAVCNMSPKDIPMVYSFADKKLHKLFKENVIGGICNVYHKLVALDQGDNWPRNAIYAPNEHRFTSALFCDINAMYGDSLRKPMPTTPGKILFLYSYIISWITILCNTLYFIEILCNTLYFIDIRCNTLYLLIYDVIHYILLINIVY